MNLIKAIINKFRIGSRRTAEAISNPVDNATLAIEDSEKQVQKFRQAISRAMATNISLIKQKKEAEENSAKFARIAKMAVDKGSDEDATQALELKVNQDKKVTSLGNDIANNNGIIQEERKQLDKITGRIEEAKGNKEILASRYESIQARKDLMKANGSVLGGSGLSALGDLAKQVDQAEAEVTAYEEISGNSTETLLERYDDHHSLVSVELAKLKAVKV